MKLKRSRKSISTTMLISMTDVVFLLIIFLLIVSNFSSQSGLPIRLPGSRSADRHTSLDIQISIYTSGKLYYNQEEIALNDLHDKLEADFEDAAQVVRLSAEEDIALQRVIDVMDIIKITGYDKIFVATESIKP